MNPDPVPPVRPLLTHMIPDEPVQREASVKEREAHLEEECEKHSEEPSGDEDGMCPKEEEDDTERCEVHFLLSLS